MVEPLLRSLKSRIGRNEFAGLRAFDSLLLSFTLRCEPALTEPAGEKMITPEWSMPAPID